MKGNDEMKRRRTEIMIETERLFYISSPRMVVDWCAVCEAQAEMISVDQAAMFCRVSSRTIFQWVEQQQVHAHETANGLLLICFNSLSDPSTTKSKKWSLLS